MKSPVFSLFLTCSLLPLFPALAQETPPAAPPKATAVVTSAEEDEVEGVIIKKDAVFVEEAEGKPVATYQSADIYAPEENLDGKRPMLVYVHGGGWSSGDKESAKEQGIFFAKKGYVFVSINHRLAPASRHPAQVEDVLAALAWVQTHGHDFGGDGQRLFLMGHSSGAHLAALAATHAGLSQKSGFKREGLLGLILLDGGAYDLKKRVEAIPADDAKAKAKMEAVFNLDDAAVKDASPLSQVAKGQTYPHVLAVHIPNPATQGQASALVKAVTEAGGKGEVLEAQNKDHSTVFSEIGKDKDAVTEKILALLKSESEAADKTPLKNP